MIICACSRSPHSNGKTLYWGWLRGRIKCAASSTRASSNWYQKTDRSRNYYLIWCPEWPITNQPFGKVHPVQVNYFPSHSTQDYGQPTAREVGVWRSINHCCYSIARHSHTTTKRNFTCPLSTGLCTRETNTHKRELIVVLLHLLNEYILNTQTRLNRMTL